MRRRRFFAAALAALGVLLWRTATGQDGDADAPRVEWTVERGRAVTFRLEYESSRRLEALGADGEPLEPAPERHEPARLVATVEWRWTRVQRTLQAADVTLRDIQELEVEGWRADPAALPKRLAAAVRLRAGADTIEFAWKGPESAKVARLTPDAEAAKRLHALVAEALGELTRLVPPAGEQAAAPGAKWATSRTYRLDSTRATELALKATAELECTDFDARRKLALIEGSIRQELVDAPPEIQRRPGLFPGKVRWIHDLARGFPREVDAEKITRAPVADARLPIVKTLTHTWRLRVRHVPPESPKPPSDKR